MEGGSGVSPPPAAGCFGDPHAEHLYSLLELTYLADQFRYASRTLRTAPAPHVTNGNTSQHPSPASDGGALPTVHAADPTPSVQSAEQIEELITQLQRSTEGCDASVTARLGRLRARATELAEGVYQLGEADTSRVMSLSFASAPSGALGEVPRQGPRQSPTLGAAPTSSVASPSLHATNGSMRSPVTLLSPLAAQVRTPATAGPTQTSLCHPQASLDISACSYEVKRFLGQIVNWDGACSSRHRAEAIGNSTNGWGAEPGENEEDDAYNGAGAAPGPAGALENENTSTGSANGASVPLHSHQCTSSSSSCAAQNGARTFAGPRPARPPLHRVIDQLVLQQLQYDGIQLSSDEAALLGAEVAAPPLQRPKSSLDVSERRSRDEVVVRCQAEIRKGVYHPTQSPAPASAGILALEGGDSVAAQLAKRSFPETYDWLQRSCIALTGGTVASREMSVAEQVTNLRGGEEEVVEGPSIGLLRRLQGDVDDWPSADELQSARDSSDISEGDYNEDELEGDSDVMWSLETFSGQAIADPDLVQADFHDAEEEEEEEEDDAEDVEDLESGDEVDESDEEDQQYFIMEERFLEDEWAEEAEVEEEEAVEGEEHLASRGDRRRTRSPSVGHRRATRCVSQHSSSSSSVLRRQSALLRQLITRRATLLISDMVILRLLQELCSIVTQHTQWRGGGEKVADPASLAKAEGTSGVLQEVLNLMQSVQCDALIGNRLREESESLRLGSLPGGVRAEMLLQLQHVMSAVGFIPLLPVSPPEPATAAGAVTQCSRQHARQFLYCVAPFLLLWGGQCPQAGDSDCSPRLSALNQLMLWEQRYQHPHPRSAGPSGPVLLSPVLTPIVWLESVCIALQDELFKLGQLCATLEVMESHRNEIGETLGQWAARRWTETDPSAAAVRPDASFPCATESARTATATAENSLARFVFPLSECILGELELLRQRGLLPVIADEECGDDQAYFSPTLGDLALPAALASVVDHRTATTFSSSEARMLENALLSTPIGRPPTAPQQTSSPLRAQFQSPLVQGRHSATTPLQHHHRGGPAHDGTSAPQRLAAVLDMPHVTSILEREDTRLLRSCQGSATTLSNRRSSQHGEDPLKEFNTWLPNNIATDDEAIKRDTFFSKGPSFGCAPSLSERLWWRPAFRATMCYCPVTRRRCVDPLVCGAILKGTGENVFLSEAEGPERPARGTINADSTEAGLRARVYRAFDIPGINRDSLAAWIAPLYVRAHRRMEVEGPASAAIGVDVHGPPLRTHSRSSVSGELQERGGAAAASAGRPQPRLLTSNLYNTVLPALTQLNPPDLLQCGHVISHKALNDLLTTRTTGRHHSDKSVACPYCTKRTPVENILTLAYFY